MNNHDVLLALHELEGIGWKTIDALRRRYPSLPDLMGASAVDIQTLGLPPGKSDLLLTRLTEYHITETKVKYEYSDIVPLSREHPGYPELLKHIAESPWVLYVRGNTGLLENPSLAIVGTRTPTVYGKRMTEAFSRDLSIAGFTVVSGMARGIDGIAHWGALNETGGTIAVLGCGINVVYPKEHAYLYREILEKGLIVSEYPPGQPAHPGLFPQRNRIIAGLSLGTLVVEAALKSGSLITADMSLDESRDVFAVPGPVTSPKSMGTNAYIQRGAAKLVMSAYDILTDYEHIIGQIRNNSGSVVNTTPHKESLPPEELRVLDQLNDGPATIDELVERLQTNFGHLHAILLSLQMKKRIEQLPGSVYVLI